MNRLVLALIIGILTASCATGADWNKPTLTDTYANFLSYLDARLDEAAQQFSQSTPTNQPVGTIRWSAANSRWESWNGSAWAALAPKYMIDVDTVDGYHISTSGATSSIPVIDSSKTITLPYLTIKNRLYSFTSSASVLGSGISTRVLFGSQYSTVLGSGIEFSAQNTLVSTSTGGPLSYYRLWPTGDLMHHRMESVTPGASVEAAPGEPVWSGHNDGAGSGLDADLLDGQHASSFRGVAQKIAGDTVQRVATTMGSYLTGTALIPSDNTIPQINEGTQILTQAITPISAANTLEVSATVMVTSSNLNTVVCSLFRSDTVTALAVSMISLAADAAGTIPIQWAGTANSTAPVLFSLRCGPVLSGTMYINGNRTVGALFGGAAGTTLRIAEVQN